MKKINPVRLFIVVYVVYAVFIIGWTKVDFINEEKRSLFVSVRQPEPKIRMYDIESYINNLERNIISPKIEKDLGSDIFSSKEDEENSKQLSQRIDERIEAEIERTRLIIVDILQSVGIPEKEQPFTYDYVLEISKTTKIPISAVLEKPDESEFVYRTKRLISHMNSNSFYKRQIEDWPAAEVRANRKSLLFFLVIFPAGAFAGLSILYFLTRKAIAWVVEQK